MKIVAEVQAYSSVVGSGVLINKPGGPMLGQIAFLCHADVMRDKNVQIAMAERIAEAINGMEIP